MFCPNCLTEMEFQKRKLGNISNWNVCPKCGLRQSINIYSIYQENNVAHFINKIRLNNSNNGNHLIKD